MEFNQIGVKYSQHFSPSAPHSKYRIIDKAHQGQTYHLFNWSKWSRKNNHHPKITQLLVKIN